MRTQPETGARRLFLVLVVMMGVSMTAGLGSSGARVRSSAHHRGADTVTRRYDVRLWMNGYTGLVQNPDCAAITDSAGYDSLIGTVQGVESTRPSMEPVLYTGVLRRKTRIDYCLPQEPAWCVVHLTGEARMTVEIELREDEGAGAWMKADPVGRAEAVSVTGNCSQQDKDEIRADFPSGESAGSPDGQAIEESATNLFSQNGIRRLRVGGVFPPNAVEGGWGMRVVRVLP
jgi:hypothetical protein